ncbi:MAG: hypothetical protein SAMD01599839_22160 [Rectinema sp.]
MKTRKFAVLLVLMLVAITLAMGQQTKLYGNLLDVVQQVIHTDFP